MSCGLSRAEIVQFHIVVNDQRCQAVGKEGRICGDLISAHPAGNPVTTNAQSKSLCFSVCIRRFLILVAFGIFVWLVAASGFILGSSGISLTVPMKSISNILLQDEELVFEFWEKALYLSTYAEGESSSWYKTELHDFDCQDNEDCIDTLEDLFTTSQCIIGASIPSMVFSILALVMLLPRISVLCLHNTKCYGHGMASNTAFYRWFVNPQFIIYVVSLFYAIVFTLSLTFFVIYNEADPTNEEFYQLALTYMNTNSEICDPSNPCTFPLGDAQLYHMFAFFVVVIIFSPVACVATFVLRVVNVPASNCLCNNVEETDQSSAQSAPPPRTQHQQDQNDKYMSIEQQDMCAALSSHVSMVAMGEPQMAKNIV
jgi:hypothetical protein